MPLEKATAKPTLTLFVKKSISLTSGDCPFTRAYKLQHAYQASSYNAPNVYTVGRYYGNRIVTLTTSAEKAPHSRIVSDRSPAKGETADEVYF